MQVYLSTDDFLRRDCLVKERRFLFWAARRVSFRKPDKNKKSCCNKGTLFLEGFVLHACSVLVMLGWSVMVDNV